MYLLSSPIPSLPPCLPCLSPHTLPSLGYYSCPSNHSALPQKWLQPDEMFYQGTLSFLAGDGAWDQDQATPKAFMQLNCTCIYSG